MRWYEDTEYQLMCEKAEEIQALRKEGKDWQFGNFFLHKGHSPPLVLSVTQADLDYGDMGCACCEGKRTYLPSQEDWQEMAFTSKDMRVGIDEQLKIAGLFFATLLAKNPDNIRIFDNWNKLWLAFVYHELYDKKWNPKKKEWEVRT